MATTELSLFSYEILGLVGREGAGPHDLLRMAQRGRMLAWAGESQYYTEPKRLAKLGYLDGPQGARQDPRAHRLHAHRQGTRGAARVRAHARRVHAAQERRAAAPADLRPRRRGGHAREHGHAARRHRRHRRAARRRRARARASSRTARSTCCSSPASCAGCLELHARARRRGRARARPTSEAQVPATRLTPLPRSGHTNAHRARPQRRLRRRGALAGDCPHSQHWAHREEARRTPLGTQREFLTQDRSRHRPRARLRRRPTHGRRTQGRAQGTNPVPGRLPRQTLSRPRAQSETRAAASDAAGSLFHPPPGSRQETVGVWTPASPLRAGADPSIPTRLPRTMTGRTCRGALEARSGVNRSP